MTPLYMSFPIKRSDSVAMLAILAGNPRDSRVAIIANTNLTLVTGGNDLLKATQDKVFGIASSGNERVAMLKASDINGYSAPLPL